jgi:glycosyltransferase involved in cell wall biosynthesis
VKIAYLNPGGSIGGAEMCLLDVLSSLRITRPDAEPVVILGDDGPLRSEVESLGIPCDVLPMPAGVARLGDAGAVGPARKLALAARGAVSAASAFGYARRLGRHLRSLRPDLIQTNGMKMHLLGAWSAPKGVPVVWHLHDYLASRPAMARLLRLAARPGIEAVAVSRSIADDARTTLQDFVAIHTIYNRVDVDRFRPGSGDGPALDRAAGLEPAPMGTVRVGLVSTFATWKGHDVFLQAASEVSATNPVRFYIVGGPIYKSAGSQLSMDELKSRASALGLSNRVGFTGHQSDPAQVLQSLDVVVHASTRPEPYGRVIVEGMACGRAVVAMSEGGAAELFRDGLDALGCPPRDPQSLALKLSRLIDDPELRHRLGLAAREAVMARFDRVGLAAEWSTLYDRAVPNAPDPGRPAPPPARLVAQ